jgi:pyruvate,water dikinase
VYDHVFVNLNALKPIIQMIPSWALTDELLKMFPPDERVTIRQNAGVILPMDLPLGVVRFSRKGAPWWFGRAAARFASFVRAKIPLVQNYKPPLPTEPASRFQESAQWLLGLLDQYLETTVWGITYAYILVPLAKRLIELWFPAHASQHLVRTALSNLPSDMNLETGRRLSDLAVRFAQTEPFERIRRDEPPFDEAERLLTGTERGRSFLEAFRDFLSAFGHRAVNRDILAPRWADDPQIPLALIRKLAESTPPRVREPMSDREVTRTLRDALPARRRTLLQPIKAPALGLSVKLARQFLPIRENMRFYADVFLYALRKLALARADGLIEKGMLSPQERNLVFFLPHQNLFSDTMDRPTTRADALLRSARSRSERFHLHRNRPLPLYVLNGQDYEALMEPDRMGRQLVGLPASPGLGRGRVRKAEGYQDFLSFRPGEVLVVPYLDPSWSSLIFHAKAVITEVGGQLSHGAIVAREYGVPAVVGVAGAMQTLSDGQEVIVDGNKGQVRVIG